MSLEETLASSAVAMSDVARMLAGLDADTAARVRGRAAEVEARREGPVVLAVAGEPGARAAFLNQVVGEELLSPGRARGAAGWVQVRRGMKADYRVQLGDGSEETFAGRNPDRREALFTAESAATREADKAGAELAAAEAEPPPGDLAAAEARWAAAESSLGEERAARDLMRDARDKVESALVPARPRGLVATLAWLLRVLLGWLLPRREAPEVTAARSQRRQELALAEARLAKAREAAAAADEERARIRQAKARLEDARAAAAAARAKRDRARDERFAAAEARKQAFRAELEALTDAARRGTFVVRLEIDAPGAPAGAVWIDLEKPGDGASEPLPIDGCLLVGAGEPPPELLAAFGRVTRTAAAERLVKALPELLPRMRALGAARAALSSVSAAEAALDELELGADVLGQHRLDELGGLRLDPAAHADAVLRAQAEGARERVRGAVALAVEKVRGELDRLAALWLAELEPARDREALARIAAGLRETSAAALGKLARGVRDRLLHAVTTGAQELIQEAAAELNGRLATLATTAGDAPTPGGSPDFRRRRLADPEIFEPARRALMAPDADPDDEAPDLTPALSGRRAAKLFDGADGGLFGRFRDPAGLRDSAVAATRERLQALREAALADLAAAEAVLTSRLAEVVRRFVTDGARAFTAAADALVAAETAGLEADLAHLRATLVSVRMELACRAPPLSAAIDGLVAEIDALV